MQYTPENTVMQGLNPTVFLDGVKVRDCLIADTTEGWVEVIKRDVDGRILVSDGEVVTETLHGVVTVDMGDLAATSES